jgi:hypothetical protein
MASVGTIEVVVKADQFNDSMREFLAEVERMNAEWWKGATGLQERFGRLEAENALLRQLLHDQTPRLVIPDEAIPVALAGAAIAATSSPRRFSRRRLLGLR